MEVQDLTESKGNQVLSEEEKESLDFIPYFASRPLFDHKSVDYISVDNQEFPIVEMDGKSAEISFSFDTHYSQPDSLKVLFMYDEEFMTISENQNSNNFIRLENNGDPINYRYDLKATDLETQYSYSDITVLSHLKDDDVATFPTHIYLSNGNEYISNTSYDKSEYSSDELIVDESINDEVKPNNKDSLPINEETSEILIAQNYEQKINQDILVYDDEGSVLQKEKVQFQPDKSIKVTLNNDVKNAIKDKELYLLIESYMDSNFLSYIPEDIPYLKQSQSYKMN
ncbi:hypothetical protein [Salinicoccus sp. CNSTN-B1]